MNTTLRDAQNKAGLTAETLPDHPLFLGLSDRHRHILTDCAMRARYSPGEMLVENGDPANCFYVILKGQISLEAPGTSLSYRVQTLGPGDILGWSWLFPPYYWHFNAIAELPVDVIFFYGSRLRLECEANHDFGYELMKRLSNILVTRLQQTREKWIDTAQNNACRDGTLADYLLI